MVLACHYGQRDCVILLLAALGRTDLNKMYTPGKFVVSFALLVCALITLKIALTSLLASYNTNCISLTRPSRIARHNTRSLG